jgi:RNA 3'-terminal phosphate cyclase
MADTRNRIQRMGQGITMSTPTEAEIKALRSIAHDADFKANIAEEAARRAEELAGQLLLEADAAYAAYEVARETLRAKRRGFVGGCSIQATT